MPQLHTVEAAWRRFRGGSNGALLKRSLALRKSFLVDTGLQSLPPEVVMPDAVPWNLIAREEARARGDVLSATISTEGAILANTMVVWAAYRTSKTIYEIDPLLAQCLARSSFPDQTPSSALRLPSVCPILKLPYRDETVIVAACYDLLTGEESSGALELRLSQLNGEKWFPICILHLVGTTLSQCIAEAARRAEQYSSTKGTLDLWRTSVSGLAIIMLLYIAGESDIVAVVHPGTKPLVKPKLARTDPERFKDLREPTVRVVGQGFARAIERWEIDHRDDPEVASGRTVRPHMRRAHSHLYWTGPGRSQPLVRFLLPITVKGGRLEEEPQTPTLTRVR